MCATKAARLRTKAVLWCGVSVSPADKAGSKAVSSADKPVWCGVVCPCRLRISLQKLSSLDLLVELDGPANEAVT